MKKLAEIPSEELMRRLEEKKALYKCDKCSMYLTEEPLYFLHRSKILAFTNLV